MFFVRRFLWPWLNQGLLTSSGKKWHGRRKLLTPAFHFKILDEFRIIMNDQSAIMVGKLKELASSGKEKDIFPSITYCALDIICQAALGTNYNAQGLSGQSPYVKSVFKASDIVFQRILSPWIWNNTLFNLSSHGKPMRECLKILHDTTDKVIQERKDFYAETKRKSNEGNLDVIEEEDDVMVVGKKRRLAFLDLLIESSDGGRVLSDADIREEVRRRLKGKGKVLCALSPLPKGQLYTVVARPLGHPPRAKKKT